MTDYANPDALVATDWLEEHLDDPDVRVIEVDEDTTAYEKGHIRGAVGWNWNTDLHTAVGRDYKDQDGFAELLAAAGRRRHDHGRALRRQQQLVRGLRVLAPEAPWVRAGRSS